VVTKDTRSKKEFSYLSHHERLVCSFTVLQSKASNVNIVKFSLAYHFIILSVCYSPQVNQFNISIRES